MKGLEWAQVDMQRRVAWVHPDQAKAGRGICVPLNVVATDVIQRQVGKHPQFVFTYDGKPVKAINPKAWKKALRLAGIEDFRGTTCDMHGQLVMSKPVRRRRSCRN